MIVKDLIILKVYIGISYCLWNKVDKLCVISDASEYREAQTQAAITVQYGQSQCLLSQASRPPEQHGKRQYKRW